MCMCAYEGLELLLKRMQRFYKVAKQDNEQRFTLYKEQLALFGKLAEHFNVPLFDVSEALCSCYELQLESLYDIIDSFNASDKSDELKCIITKELDKCNKYYEFLIERNKKKLEDEQAKIALEKEKELLLINRKRFINAYENLISYIKLHISDEYVSNIISDLDYHFEVLSKSRNSLSITLFENTLNELLKVIMNCDCHTVIYYKGDQELKRLARNVTSASYLC